jgi:hypothetical protein
MDKMEFGVCGILYEKMLVHDQRFEENKGAKPSGIYETSTPRMGASSSQTLNCMCTGIIHCS